MSARAAAVVLFPAAVFRLAAADLETQHAFEVTLPLRPGFEMTLHARGRTQPGGLGFFQGRAGPILSWKAAPRLGALFGYYYAQQQQRIDEDYVAGHRFFSGAEVAVLDNRRVLLEQRFVAERFLSQATADFNRYRFRSRLSATGELAPYLAHEFFLDARGWRSNRHSAGIRWRPRAGIMVEFGYLYERRRQNVGPHRHVGLTTINWKWPSRR
jgi:hypothetical protein